MKTAIFAKTEALDFTQYEDSEYSECLERLIESSQRLSGKGLEPEVIGELVVQILEDPSPKTRYPVLKNKFRRWTLPRLLPPRVRDRILARRVGIAGGKE